MSTEAATRLAERIKAEVAKAPPLTDERIDELIGLLSGSMKPVRKRAARSDRPRVQCARV